MARIRSVKPQFFIHEGLQDLEVAHPDLKPMLVFAALWGHADRNGVFKWRPRQLALEILPLVWSEAIGKQLGASLELLRENGFLLKGFFGKETYGIVVNFGEHQRLSGKEAQQESSLPKLEDLTVEEGSGSGSEPGKHPGSNGEAPVKHPGALEGKGREGKGTGVASLRCSHEKEEDQEARSLSQWYRDQYLQRVDPLYKYPSLSAREVKAARSLLSAYGLAGTTSVALAVLADNHPPQGARGWTGWAKNCRTVSKLLERWSEFEQLTRDVVPSQKPSGYDLPTLDEIQAREAAAREAERLQEEAEW